MVNQPMLFPNLKAARILVAESDPDDMDHTSHILETAGYYVHKAYFAGDVVFALSQADFDLAVIDVRMQDRDQPSISEQISQFRKLRWIALVAHAGNQGQKYLRNGAAAYLQRPYQPEDLLNHIDNVLRGYDMTPTPQPAAAAGQDHQEQDRINHILQRRLVEQQTLSHITRSLSAVLDLDTLLTQVVDAAVSLSNAEEGLLLLPDEEGHALYIRAVKGIDSETAKHFRIKTQDTMAGQVFQLGKPILVGDQGLQKIKTEYLVKSLLYVPLSIRHETIGVLGVNNKNADRTFKKHDLELLQDLAAHAAVAIENARLYEERVQQAHELHTLVEAGRAANSTLAVDQVLSNIASQLISALNVTRCYIGEWNPDEHRLDALAITSRIVWPLAEGPRLSAHVVADIEDAFKHKRIAVTTPAYRPRDHALLTWLPHHYRAQGAAHVPIATQDQPLGVFSVYRLHTPYTERDAVSNRHIQLQEYAFDLIVKLSSSETRPQPGSLFPSAQKALDALGADWCELALWNPEIQAFQLALSYGEAIWYGDDAPALDLDQTPTLAHVLTRQAAFADTPPDDLRALSQLGLAESLLGVPMTIKDQTIGLVLVSDTTRKRRFSRREVAFARALVVQAANALSNARLYRDLELSLEELHRTQTKLVQNARLLAMGELAAAVAHQINNPLTTILGDAELMLRDLPPDDPNAEAMDAIFRAGKRAHEVVRRLLTMARHGESDETAIALDVNQTIDNTLTLVRSHVQHGSVDLIVNLEDGLPPVQSVEGELEDVWLNLLLNARDAVVDAQNPEIGIATRYRAQHNAIEIEVWDNGTGIDEETLGKIFEPFFTSKPAGEGTGLGLHICRQIIEKCSGHIDVESTYNEGTSFKIYLPAFDRQDAS
jgi:signal transduction histidine kinase/DNA-binding response OmpR family regulator